MGKINFKIKMKFIKFVITFTCFAVVLLSSSSKDKSSGEPRKDSQASLDAMRSNAYRPEVFNTNTFDKCVLFELGRYWNKKIVHFRCRKANRDFIKLKINMNSFIGNSGGKMVRGSGYYRSCKDYHMGSYGKKKGILSGKCKNGKGGYTATSVDISPFLVWKGDKLSVKE